MPPRLLQTFPNGFGQELAKVTKNYPQIHMAKGYDGRIGETSTFIFKEIPFLSCDIVTLSGRVRVDFTVLNRS